METFENAYIYMCVCVCVLQTPVTSFPSLSSCSTQVCTTPMWKTRPH